MVHFTVWLPTATFGVTEWPVAELFVVQARGSLG